MSNGGNSRTSTNSNASNSTPKNTATTTNADTPPPYAPDTTPPLLKLRAQEKRIMSFWRGWMSGSGSDHTAQADGSNAPSNNTNTGGARDARRRRITTTATGSISTTINISSPGYASDTLLQQASERTKADIQEIINKHQAAALLEANQNIRDLQQEREDHIEKLEVQKRIIEHLNQERVLEQEKQEKQQQTQLIEELQKQLREKDDIIDKLQKNQNQQTPLTNGSHSPNPLKQQQEKEKEEVQQLKETIQTLTDKVEEQQEEIDRLQSVLREIEAFHNANSNSSNDMYTGSDTANTTSTTHNHHRDHHHQTQHIAQIVEEEEDEEEEEEEEDDVLFTIAEEEGPISPSSASSLPTHHYQSEEEDEDDDDDDEEQWEALNQLHAHHRHHQHTQQQQRPPTMTLNGNQLVLLISTMPANNTVKANQKRLEIILQGLCLSPDEVQLLDGCDPTSLQLRNDLFAISGCFAKYPQLFLVNFQQNDISFVGDFDAVMDLHDSHKLESTVGLTPL